MEIKYEISAPKPCALVESLRSVGYSLPTAIADIVDNSVAAHAQNIWIGFHWAGPDSCVSIVDDGTIASARGSINVDDEGNLAERTLLVDRGVLRTFMHDRISARHYGIAPTGNGRRESFRHAPLPRMRNTYMLAGPHAREEIIRSVRRGIYAVSFTNGQVQIGAGDFTFYIKTGYLIEDGKLTTPIKDVNLIGNGPRVLQDVVMVGDDLEIDQGGWTCGKDGQSVPVSLGLPTLKISAITVGGISPRTAQAAGDTP